MNQNDWEYVVKPQIQEMDNLFNVFEPGTNEDIDELRAEQRAYLDVTFEFDVVKHKALVLSYIQRYNQAMFDHYERFQLGRSRKNFK
jgi:hypothetical protein